MVPDTCLLFVVRREDIMEDDGGAITPVTESITVSFSEFRYAEKQKQKGARFLLLLLFSLASAECRCVRTLLIWR